MTEARLPPSLREGWTLVDFYATWCGPCQMLSPIIETVAARFSGRLRVAKLDVDRSPHVAAAFGVSSMPTMILCKDGYELARRVGFLPEPQLAAWIEGTLSAA